eukprot:9022920-Karenia_brevis.AAC.1
MGEVCLQAFASETLNIAEKIGMWNNLKVKPTGLMPDHVECLDSLLLMLDLLKTGDAVLDRLTQFKDAVAKHQTMFPALYPGHCTPKGVHFPWHFGAQLEEVGCNLSLFAAERMHKIGKSIGNR